MARLFISHSSADRDQSLALVEWLVKSHWVDPDDIFLDADPQRGIPGFVEWPERLKLEVERCEAMLALVSKDSCSSEWCKNEILLSIELGKKLFFLLLVDDVRPDAIPGFPKHSRQVIPFYLRGGDPTHVSLKDPATGRRSLQWFPEDGLLQLKRAMDDSGVVPNSFDLPLDASEPSGYRAPYRGLSALEEEDAAVFFGREANIAETLGKFAELHRSSLCRMAVVLGASGAGKSSFVRAGLLPRMRRNESQWLPLRPVRAAGTDSTSDQTRGAIEGADGLLRSLRDIHERFQCGKNLAVLRECLATEIDFVNMLKELQEIGRQRTRAQGLPLVVLFIDQGEELFDPSTAAASKRLMELACAGMREGVLLTVVAIRSDAYPRLQGWDVLEGVRRELIDLAPVPGSEISTIIREPAKKLRTKSAQTPVFDEKVVQQLAREVQDQPDALPLLSTALRRLMREYSTNEVIGPTEYAAQGSILKSIEYSAADAMQQVGIPDDAFVRRDNLRILFIPRLVAIDVANGIVRRRPALLRDVAPTSRPLVDKLIENRLLVTKGEGPETTIEVAHEAVLRSWSLLSELVDAEKSDLGTLSKLISAAREWHGARESEHSQGLLIHVGSLLIAAQQLKQKGDDWAAEVDSTVSRMYLERCVAKDKRIREDQRAGEERLIHRQRQIVMEVERKIAGGRFDAALRIALVAEVDRHSRDQPEIDDAVLESGLARAAHGSRLVEVLARHPEAIPTIAFSPDGKCLATGAQDGFARVFNLDTGKVFQQQLHFASGVASPWINGIAFLPAAGRMQIVTGGRDRMICVWSPEEGSVNSEIVTRLGPASDEVRSIAVSRDGKWVVAGCSNGTVEIWQICTRRRFATCRWHSSSVLGVALSPDGRFIAAAGKDGRNGEGGRVYVGKFPRRLLFGRSPITRSVWRSALARREFHGVAFSPDGRLVAGAGYDGTGRVWNARSGELAFELRGHEGPLRSIAFSAHGDRIATSSGDETVRIWDAKAGRQLLRLAGHEGWVHSVAFSNDDTRLASGGFDCTARIWDPCAGSQIAGSIRLTGDNGPIAISGNGQLLVTGSSSEPLRLLQVPNLLQIAGLPTETKNVRRVFLSLDNTQAHLLMGTWEVTREGKKTGLREGPLRTIALSSNTSSDCIRGYGAAVTAADFSADGSRVAVATKEGSVEVYDGVSGARLAGPFQHCAAVTDLALSPRSNWLVSSGDDGTLEVWKIDGGIGALWSLGQVHKGFVHRVVFHPDGKHFVSVGADRRALVWDLSGRKPFDELYGHTDQVVDACYDQSGRRLATACRDRIVRLFNTADHKLLAEFPVLEHATALAFDPSGRYLAATAAGNSGGVSVWDTTFLGAFTGRRLARAVAEHRLRGGGTLSRQEASDLTDTGVVPDALLKDVAAEVLSLIPALGGDADRADGHLIENWIANRKLALAFEQSQLAKSEKSVR